MTMKIRFHGIQSQQEKRLRRILKPLLRFLPEWTNEFSVIREDNPENLGSASFEREYRRASIGLSDTLLAFDDDEVRRIVIHELSHGFNEGIISFFNEVLPSVLSQEQYNIIQPLFVREMEAGNEDLAIMLAGLKEN